MSEREVNHPRYGHGVVKQTRHGGFELEVAFQDGITRWVRGDEVTEIGEKPPVPPHPPPPDFCDFSEEHLRSRRMIEAFRLGIVPYDCVEEFTFGRDEETEQVKQWLRSSDESTLFIIGGYGTGKTHLLHYARGIALKEGFAVGWIEMDPNEAPFHKPKAVYSRIIHNLKYPSKPNGKLKGFRDFLKEALAQGAFYDHIYFKHLSDHLSDHSAEIFWEWIEASEAIPRPEEWIVNNWGYRVDRYQFLPGLYDYATAANIYCYLLSALGWAAKEVLGLNGLLLIFDEAETLTISNTLRQQEKGRKFLRALILTANNKRSLLALPPPPDLDYCRVGIGPKVPFLYKDPSNLKLIFAFTSFRETNRSRIDLQPLTGNALKEVFEHICSLYDSSYNSLLEGSPMVEAIFRKVKARSGGTRHFVKASVEALDLIRWNSSKPLDEVLG